MKNTLVAIAALAAIVVASCAPGTALAVDSAQGNSLAQFGVGLWHGIIAPFSLAGELVNHFFPGFIPWSIHMYETRLVGPFYDFGYYIGLAVFSVGLSFRVVRRSSAGH